jgi:flagellar biosynthetic protein FliP
MALTVAAIGLVPAIAAAADIELPGVRIDIRDGTGEPQQTATALRLLIAFTILSLAPSILIMMTSFTRIIIVLAILRHAFSMPQTPPNTVLISLALFLTLFNMMPALQEVNDKALQPFMEQKMSYQDALDAGLRPLRAFMIRQTREQDLNLMVELSKTPKPGTMDEVRTHVLIPAFMLSELRAGFSIGFMIFVPFLLIDIVVASILMSMGMLMVPPVMFSLPIKILMFVLIDGWSLLVNSLLSSFK